ncbi:hypothetical protein ACFQFC_11115 [Amorphoplanes digitatis]|uniref:Phosphatidic acid phosphatase type 2/haloperoxidase domain-containing protein n=1 Tax=Actinoplanes digitatis TaxID=1868 RepID=A0A7W7I1W8_9ACTN|nr:hypothetical protein [Actinoplanes digitatis]MBB4764748.1 hypothetical protein [Actinoplanes digitatis]
MWPASTFLAAPASSARDDPRTGYRVLLSLFPAQADALRARYDEALAVISDGRAKRGGIRVGKAAAAATIADRRDDGAFSDATWPVGTAPGAYRLTPPGFVQAGAGYAFLKPFAIDGNPATVADPAWTPLRVTAPSPEWPSGHACYTSAIMAALRTFFGRDDLSFSAYSAESGTTRHFDSLSSARTELMGARIWAGVHYRGA